MTPVRTDNPTPSPPALPAADSFRGLQGFRCDKLTAFPARSAGHRLMEQRPLPDRPQSAAASPPPTQGQAAQTSFFLRTKLLPPRPAPALLSRPRLTERLEANLAHPVTLVMANAGSGKTTLV